MIVNDVLKQIQESIYLTGINSETKDEESNYGRVVDGRIEKVM